MIDFEKKSSYGVEDLREIVRILRAPGGCPWDREQDHHSIRRNLLEEAYEAAEAIDEGNPEHLQEELGDVLLQVVCRSFRRWRCCNSCDERRKNHRVFEIEPNSSGS